MDRFRSSVLRPTAFAVFFAFLLVAIIPSNGAAYVVGIDGEKELTEASRAADMSKVQRVLESKIVAKRLSEMGLSSEEIDRRLTALSDAEVHQFAMQTDNLYSGEGSVGTILIIAAVLVLVVFAFMSLTGRRLVVE